MADEQHDERHGAQRDEQRREHDERHDRSTTDRVGSSRRAFLQTAGLAGLAGATGLGGATAFPAIAAAAPAGTSGVVDTTAGTASSAGTATTASRGGGNGGRWQPDTESLQFTVAVMPDTQFLYWGSQNSVDSDPQVASFRYVIENSGRGSDDNIVFMAHLGDLTEDADPSSFRAVGRAFDTLDQHGVAYSVLAGNHDVTGDDSRGSTPYLQTMGPQRFRRAKTFAGSDPSGYNTAHVFRAAGREWLLLAMDWRTTEQGFAWADAFIKSHPGMPVILTSHEIVGSTYDDNVYPYASGDPDANAVFTDYGTQVWDRLIAGNDQVFLTLNGHFWPPGRTTKQNTAGHRVDLHITNYQNRYFGGGGMLRLYHFDLARDTIDVETLSPWILAQDPGARNELAVMETRLTTAVDRFSIPIDFEQRFAGFIPVPVRAARPAKDVLVPGTVAYWRFDAGGAAGTPVTSAQTVRDLSGRGNDLTLAAVPGSQPTTLTWSVDHHPDQPGHASLQFDGGRNPLRGAYLTTATKAPLNTATFTRGYTIETFVQMSLDWDAGDNGWAAVLSRRGAAGKAGKSGGNTDPGEPVVQLAISNNGREPQFNCYPTNQSRPTTNWGQGLVEQRWWHIAVVNDGRHTRMYVEGALVADNPSTVSVGIATLGLPWLLGGHEYDGAIDQVFQGWIGDVRIVDRPLSAREFLTAG